MWTKIIGHVLGILVFTALLRAHLVLFFLIQCATVRSWRCFVCFLFSQLLFLEFGAIFSRRQALRNAHKALADFLLSDHFQLQPLRSTAIMQVVSNEEPMISKLTQPTGPVANPAVRERAGFSTSFEPIKIFLVRAVVPPFPLQLKAFISTIGTSFLFLRDIPGELDPIAWFKVFHEFGHAGPGGRMQMFDISVAFPYALFTAIVTLLMIPTRLHLTVMVFYVFFQWFYVSRNLRIESEIQADNFALRMLRSASAVRSVVNCFDAVWAEEAEHLGPRGRRDRLLRLVFMRRFLEEAERTPGVSYIPPLGPIKIENLLFAGYFAWQAFSSARPQVAIVVALMLLKCVAYALKMNENRRLLREELRIDNVLQSKYLDPISEIVPPTFSAMVPVSE
jgi:hypothetical protein